MMKIEEMLNRRTWLMGEIKAIETFLPKLDDEKTKVEVILRVLSEWPPYHERNYNIMNSEFSRDDIRQILDVKKNLLEQELDFLQDQLTRVDLEAKEIAAEMESDGPDSGC
jgi:hypothetical protein